MVRKLFLLVVLTCIQLGVYAQTESQKKLSLTFQSGINMGRWIYDKGLSEPSGGFHQGYDRTHLALYIPIGIQAGYNWKKWTLGISGSISWLSDDELISSTSKPLVPREYFITDGSDIQFSNLSIFLERIILDRPKYKMEAVIYGGTFRSVQSHQRETFFGTHYIFDMGINNQFYISKDWYIILRPTFKRKFITTKDSPFIGESHEIITFGLDYGFGFNLF